MTGSPEDSPSWSLLALGGLALTSFALTGAGVTLVLSLIDPAPLLFILPFLFGPLAAIGGGLGWAGYHKVRRSAGTLRGARPGIAGALLAGITVLGVLPTAFALGLPGFREHQLRSREAQALHFLSRLRMGAISYRHESRREHFPPGDSGWTPSTPPSERRYPYAAELWAEEPWSSLDFAPSAAHFHQYRYRSLKGGLGFVVSARGDLDGDGRMAAYTSTVSVAASGQIVQEGPERHPADAL